MKKKYDQEFKLGAVNLVAKDNRPVAAIANELGICIKTLYKWICQIQD